MHNGKTKISKHILTIALASIIVLSVTSAAVMSGCGESSESTNETRTITETELVTVVVDGTTATDANGNAVSAENTGSRTSSDGSNSGEKNESSSSEKTNNSGSSSSSANSSSGNSNSSSSASSNSSSKTNSSSASSNSSSSSSKTNSASSNTHKPVTNSNACTLDGHKFAVGDTVTCVYKLTAPEKLENYQAYITYDTKYLSVKSAYLDGPADSGGLLNYNLNGKIKFNGSNITKGYNYTKEDNFVVVNYEIKASGSTKPKFNWEVATGVSKKAYVIDNKPSSGLKITKEYL